jgi:60 kDa SS-A/Ro ribonucleoprotein
MALITLHAEPMVEVVGFAGGLSPLGLSRRQRLDDAVSVVSNLNWSHTDCSLPFIFAKEHNKKYESVIVYTDSETWFGGIHPKQALDQYRQHSGINVKSVVVGMVANNFSIADPTDPGMLDVVGFDTSAPALISEFVAGRM